VDAEAIVKLATSLPFAVLIAIWMLWRIEPLLARLIRVESAELELHRLMAARELGADTVNAVCKKHGLEG